MEKEKKTKLIALVILVGALFFFQEVSALTGNSSSYSVSMFGTGMATGNSESGNYNSTFLSESKGTTRNSESNSFTGNIGFFDNTAYSRTVSISSYSISPTSAEVGSTISLYISATNSQSVWAVVTSPNDQGQTVSLVNNEFVTYAPPSVVGTYTVTFYANSSTGAIASVIDSFELTEQTTSSGSSSSGGGGGSSSTTIIEKCTYNYDCTPWSVCADGKQKRICENVGTCEGNESKPTEEMQCSEALFDILLKLKNIELTENKTLKFSIDLTEKMGVEKIDVHIKYSVIKDNEEIFSQIETKAIQESLFYEKGIEEIKLSDGYYILRVDILYGNLQRAFAEQKFRIVDGKIETSPKEKLSVIDGIKNILNNSYIIIIIIIGTISLSSLLIFKENRRSTKFKKAKSRRKYFVYSLLTLLIFGFLAVIITTGTGITGKVTNKLASYGREGILILSIIIFFIALLIILRKRIFSAFRKIAKAFNKLPKNSIKGTIGKKVYTDDGHVIGKVEEIILFKNKIDSLIVKLEKKKKFKVRKISIKYRNVKSAGEVVIVDGKILEKIKSL